MQRTAKRLRSAAAMVVVVLLLALAPAMARAAGTRPFSVTITHVECVDPCDEEGLEGVFEGHPDFFAKVFINGVEHRTPTIDNNSGIDPFWVVSTELPSTVENVPVTIQIWDEDDAPGGDDLGDDTPHHGDNNLDFTVSYLDGKWRDPAAAPTDNVNWPQSCSSGDGGDEPAVRVCWDVSTISAGGDADGDGLLDGWERNGYDDNGDGTIDVDLSAMGADPDHKDLFLELDAERGRTLTREGIQAMKKAFAAAPPGAGASAGERGGVAAPLNPDGVPGINLHVDTGRRVDPTASEGAPTGSCSDGKDNAVPPDGLIDGNDPSCIGRLTNYLDASVENPGPSNCGDNLDNDGDGLADDRDPDCLVGDDLGGGDIFNLPVMACTLDVNFYNAKAQHFNQNRRWIFRYGILAAQPAAPTCHPKLISGGWGEIGGNDFVVFNQDAGTIFHEFGHTLNLQHGGSDPTNCKPNYVSGMNYDHQSGIPRVGGGTVLDYSPPRIKVDGTSRGHAPLADLVENGLTEPTVLDASDQANRFTYVNSLGAKVTQSLAAPANWNGDADPPYEGAAFTANIDTRGAGGGPVGCANATSNETLHGFDDWRAVSLPFRQFGDSGGGGIGTETTPSPTTAEMIALSDEVNTADLGVTLTDGPDPVAAGTDITYTAVVTNKGPNPSAATTLTDTLPALLAFVGADPACHASGSTVTCGLGDLGPGAARTVTITAHVPAGLVHDAGGPLTLTDRAVVDNLAGPDPQPADDTATTDTRVVAVADLAVTDLTAQAPPTQLVIGRTVDVTLRSTVANSGPSSPMDARLVTAAAPDPGATVVPATAEQAVPALAVGAPRTVDTTVTVGCAEPGSHTYRFTASVTPARPDDTDPVEPNNHRPVEFTLDCVVPVMINIEPPTVAPSLVLVPHSEVTLAVLTTRAGEYGLPIAFDATTVLPPTARFGARAVVHDGTGGSTEPHAQGHPMDVVERTEHPAQAVKDGDLDLVLHFDTERSGLRPGDTEACVKGEYTDRASGRTFRFLGCDAVRVVRF
ncbi:hypothetical protein [Kitasatospora sp. NPDC094015]|uniref:hypothetical protein n=1 Tax=Kitasatospora sp. NPDC094015 TaxID=3155205 RepID=UPI0033286816